MMMVVDFDWNGSRHTQASREFKTLLVDKLPLTSEDGVVHVKKRSNNIRGGSVHHMQPVKDESTYTTALYWKQHSWTNLRPNRLLLFLRETGLIASTISPKIQQIPNDRRQHQRSGRQPIPGVGNITINTRDLRLKRSIEGILNFPSKNGKLC
jgi:hypothetical protein